MNKFKCKYCDKDFEDKRKIAKYCSHKCANNATRFIRRSRIKLICEYCKKQFEVTKGDLKYRKKIRFCSRNCYKKGIVNKSLYISVGCDYCKKPIIRTITYKNRYKHHFCNNECKYKYLKDKPLNKKNGWWLENGYKVIYIGNGNGKKEHIINIEKWLNRKLKKNECVHHIDGNKLNNNLNNLQLMTFIEHTKLHRKINKKITGICEN